VGGGPILATSSWVIPLVMNWASPSLLLQDPQGRVAGPGELPGLIRHPVEELPQVQVRGDGQARGVEIVEPLDLFSLWFLRSSSSRARARSIW
jgi:hypothetical protein